MLRNLQIALIILIILGLGVYGYQKLADGTIREILELDLHMVRIGENTLGVRVADTDTLREQGLAGVTELPLKQGMLFVFDTNDRHGIWMKGMGMTIDIIWIDAEFRVIGIEQDVSPETYPKIFRPPVPVKYVIETDATYTETFGVRVGDVANLQKWADK